MQDEAYGGSAASEDEEVRQITGDSEDNRADDSEDQDVRKLVKNSTKKSYYCSLLHCFKMHYKLLVLVTPIMTEFSVVMKKQ